MRRRYPRAVKEEERQGIILLILVILAFIAICLTGCARFSTRQTDTSYDEFGKPARTITTKVTAYTFFSARSDLAKFSATTTDKTQSSRVGSLSQESTETNLVNALGAGIGTALKVYTGKP